MDRLVFKNVKFLYYWIRDIIKYLHIEILKSGDLPIQY